MHRSSSATQVSELFTHSSSSSPSQNFRPSSDANQLPTYNPQSHVAKKERIRLRSAETAVHVIPLLLVLCAIILWFFSNPVDVMNKGNSIVPRIESLMIDGDISSGSTKSNLLSSSEQRDFDSTEQSAERSHTRLMKD
ncbi:hypothetical protein F0562_007882 [Nyssa sinensis]|uniref:Uncharacterized protein n=1 Tax=Nyssa sinensis TaxID=561372 RepID=A0A5J5A7L4_9ASTE|nr:hypothetical protein F0562_007882 [Nyssa sinensis]